MGRINAKYTNDKFTVKTLGMIPLICQVSVTDHINSQLYMTCPRNTCSTHSMSFATSCLSIRKDGSIITLKTTTSTCIRDLKDHQKQEDLLKYNISRNIIKDLLLTRLLIEHHRKVEIHSILYFAHETPTIQNFEGRGSEKMYLRVINIAVSRISWQLDTQLSAIR
jgi:hypothetical protein